MANNLLEDINVAELSDDELEDRLYELQALKRIVVNSYDNKILEVMQEQSYREFLSKRSIKRYYDI